MEYNCKVIPVNKIIPTEVGALKSMCDDCSTKDCTNPIRFYEISIFGINRKGRFFTRGNEPNMVIQCEGFILYENDELREIYKDEEPE